MRHLAIGDIHGCFTALAKLAEYVSFRNDDVVVTLGDYVDRGPDSCKVLDWLVWFFGKGHLVPLMGNHEVMMLKARHSRDDMKMWLESGGDWALKSYSPFGDRGKLADVPAAHWEFLERHTRKYFETKTHFFVHANAYPELPLDEQPDYMLLWEPFGFVSPHESGKIMVCGHTQQKSGRPWNLGHAVCIDTWAYGGGWLTCLDVGTGQYWQANQKGETRTDHLELGIQ